ncbi:hypothetical protein K8D10_00360 [Aeromonas veronii]|uniref:hypothetical protein n=1 Tax=Aeromonas veronii TaxID=654 RepID=UPI00207CA589|nr:hypothetical protein [Aeromonas veronii]MCO4170254.1 hypothetical protein [Aeromonas veronii]
MPIPAKPFWLSAAYAEFGGNRWMSDTANRAGIPAPRWLGDLAGRSAWTWAASVISMAHNSAVHPNRSTAAVYVQQVGAEIKISNQANQISVVTTSGLCDVHAAVVSGRALSSGTMNTWLNVTTGVLGWTLTPGAVLNTEYASVVRFTFRSRANPGNARAYDVSMSAQNIYINEM